MISLTDPVLQPLPRNAPRVLVPACSRQIGDHPFHAVGRKYIEAVRLSGAYPIIVPAAHPHELEGWLEIADGILLTGSASNVHPSHFGSQVRDACLPLDPVRDAWTLPLVPLALSRGLPLLAICRGFQETNVALGGSLHQAVHEEQGLRDHRAEGADTVDDEYGPSHWVYVEPGGVLDHLLEADRFQVNSIHGQGLDRLGKGVRVEARAPDGLVEAFSVQGGPGFALCVQWHPEWKAGQNMNSMAMFKAFGVACQAWRDVHRPPSV